MKIIDISQEFFSCAVFPGDVPPVRRVLETIEGGCYYVRNGGGDGAPCRAILIKGGI